MQVKTKASPVWDKSGSTYMRIIFLQNGHSLTGYSKKFGQNERRDRIDLLTNWILRDFKSGYLDRKTTVGKVTPLDHIEYFIKDNDTYRPVINLYYDFPEWVDPAWMDYKKFLSFINRFYGMIRQGRTPSEISNALEVRTRASSRDPFDLSSPRFLLMADLNAYVQRLKVDSTLEHEAIHNFYKKYIEKYFQRKTN